MDLKQILKHFEHCKCGRIHTFDLQTYKAESGLVHHLGRELIKAGFPQPIFIVADQNTLEAAKGVLPSLDEVGIAYHIKVYDDMRFAYLDDALTIKDEAEAYAGILSIGTGSLNDICRYAASESHKPLAIFPTAPSMDGFASDSAPLIANNFKISYPSKQPMVILADTQILADAPIELKAAGFGDMMAKYIAIVDWKLSHYLTGEYLCPRIIDLVKKTTDQVLLNADKVALNDPKVAHMLLDALIITGCAMQLAKSTRAASGGEHVVSHFWEIHKLARGEWPDYHGKKVGLATALLIPMYKSLLKYEKASLKKEVLDLDDILKHYHPHHYQEIIGYNVPSIMETVDYQAFTDHFEDLKAAIRNDLPDEQVFLEAMKKAHAVTNIQEAHISEQFAQEALRYSPYMRRRMTMLRIWGLMDLK